MRAPWVIGATLAGVAGIIAFHPHSSLGALTFNTPGARAVGGTSSNGSALSGAPPASGPPGATTPGSGSTQQPTTTTLPPGSTSSPTTSPTTTPTTTAPTTTPRPTATSGTASGNITQYPYGELQVTATVSGGRITDISTQVQSDDPRSQQIDDASLPVLRAQALSAQGAGIQGVSGATYTSQAFVSSLQSALSALGFDG